MSVLLADIVNRVLYYNAFGNISESKVNSALVRLLSFSNSCDLNFLTLVPEHVSFVKELKKLKKEYPNVNFLDKGNPKIPGSGLLIQNHVSVNGSKNRTKAGSDPDIDSKYYDTYIRAKLDSLDLSLAFVSGYLKDNFKSNLVDQLITKKYSNPLMKICYFGNNADTFDYLKKLKGGNFLKNLSFAILKDEDFSSENPSLVNSKSLTIDNIGEGLIFSFDTKKNKDKTNFHIYFPHKNELYSSELDSKVDRSFLELSLMNRLFSKIMPVSLDSISRDVVSTGQIFAESGSSQDPSIILKDLKRYSQMRLNSANAFDGIFPSGKFKMNEIQLRSFMQQSGNGNLRSFYTFNNNIQKGKFYLAFGSTNVCDDLGSFCLYNAKICFDELFNQGSLPLNRMVNDYVNKIKLNLNKLAKNPRKSKTSGNLLARPVFLTLIEVDKQSKFSYKINSIHMGSGSLSTYEKEGDDFIIKEIQGENKPLFIKNNDFKVNERRVDLERKDLYILVRNYALSSDSYLNNLGMALNNSNPDILDNIIDSGIPNPYSLKADSSFVLVKMKK